MKVFHSLTAAIFSKKTIVTIGTFDGVHLGHQKIIKRLLDSTKSNDYESVIITFSQHPRSVLHTNSDIKLLNTTEEKIKLLEKSGLDNLVILEFNKQLSELSGEEFVKTILVDILNIQKIIIGYDHKFGKDRSSDIHDLTNFGKKYHFDVEQISAEECNEITISSTKIRKAITEGNIKLANQFLGYPFSFSGKVVLGKQLGRTIDFPTANIQIEHPLKITPKQGVYIVTGNWDNNSYQGMMNIGNRPTVDGKNTTIEIHFFNINEDLYNKEITISVLQFLREEEKFNSIDELKEQLRKDQEVSLQFFRNL
ncbi:MAG: bifunctional riboflavin kinase/FAD synthetase [Bacteroidota bacterium]